ncbi:MAG: hypothetical protein ACKO6N_25160, partial [Myxococcota bacterium]
AQHPQLPLRSALLAPLSIRSFHSAPRYSLRSTTLQHHSALLAPLSIRSFHSAPRYSLRSTTLQLHTA